MPCEPYKWPVAYSTHIYKLRSPLIEAGFCHSLLAGVNDVWPNHWPIYDSLQSLTLAFWITHTLDSYSNLKEQSGGAFSLRLKTGQ